MTPSASGWSHAPSKTVLNMKYVPLILKTLLLLICFFSYFCMMKVLYCGCWACKTGVVIGIIGLAICLYDRYRELHSILDNTEQ